MEDDTLVVGNGSLEKPEPISALVKMAKYVAEVAEILKYEFKKNLLEEAHACLAWNGGMNIAHVFTEEELSGIRSNENKNYKLTVSKDTLKKFPNLI
ncbi:hypothetical protein QJS10_CPA03g01529 [Acorus calamus]|uniref:Uncharacterized protein n=1 Tax=Acorus calamus TaxID=4465 RepID=A0AAV9FBR0_ACOCL|nr:hypothetical protein QJS10_CPA03g01529 [Acorus calamus]